MTDSDFAIIVEVSKDLADLIPEYLDSMNQSISYLESLVAEKNWEELKKEGHKMKGHGGAYGFLYISDMGILIEGFAKEAKGELIKKCLAELKVFMSKVKVEFY